jgi:hypothetical protein
LDLLPDPRCGEVRKSIQTTEQAFQQAMGNQVSTNTSNKKEKSESNCDSNNWIGGIIFCEEKGTE